MSDSSTNASNAADSRFTFGLEAALQRRQLAAHARAWLYAPLTDIAGLDLVALHRSRCASLTP